MRALHAFLLTILAVPAIALPARADVITVPGPVGTIQQAVDAASDGDIVLVTPGDYGVSVVIDCKAVTITSDGDPQPGSPTHAGLVVVAEVTVRNLAPDQSVVLHGLEVVGTSAGPGTAALMVEDAAGPVLLQGCWLRGRGGFQDAGQVGQAGARIAASDGVTLVGCRVDAGSGSSTLDEFFGAAAAPGGPGLLAASSRVALYTCEVHGGIGGSYDIGESASGAHGGDALVNQDSFALVSRGVVWGGGGGGGDCDGSFLFCGSGGDGGDGLHQTGTEAHTTLNDVITAGGPGAPGFGSGSDGFPGAQTAILGGTTLVGPDPLPALALTTPVREGATGSLTVGAPPGTVVAVLFGPDSYFDPLASLQGVVQAAGGLAVLGFVPASGRLGLTAQAPLLPAAVEGLDIAFQAVASVGGVLLPGAPSVLTLLDAGL